MKFVIEFTRSFIIGEYLCLEMFIVFYWIERYDLFPFFSSPLMYSLLSGVLRIYVGYSFFFLLFRFPKAEDKNLWLG